MPPKAAGFRHKRTILTTSISGQVLPTPRIELPSSKTSVTSAMSRSVVVDNFKSVEISRTKQRGLAHVGKPIHTVPAMLLLRHIHAL